MKHTMLSLFLVALISAHTASSSPMKPHITAKKPAVTCIAAATAARNAKIIAARKRLEAMITGVKNNPSALKAAQLVAFKSYSELIKAADAQLAAAKKKCPPR